jgi:hypothetical protein
MTLDETQVVPIPFHIAVFHLRKNDKITQQFILFQTMRHIKRDSILDRVGYQSEDGVPY